MRFFPAFLEREMGLFAEVPRSVPGPGVRERTFLPSRSDDAKARRAAMPAKVTGTTPALETAAAATRAAEDAADAFAVESRLAPTGAFKLSKKPQSARRVPGSAAAATPAGSAFLAMCARIDRLRVGHVERLRLERVLNDEDLCAGLVADVPVSVVRDTIRAASCGREGKFVAYLPVCRALEAAAVAARAARAAAAEDAAARARGCARSGWRRRAPPRTRPRPRLSRRRRSGWRRRRSRTCSAGPRTPRSPSRSCFSPLRRKR